MAAGHRVSGRSGGHDKSRCVEGSDQCLDNGQTGSNRITFGLLTNRPLVRMNSPGRAIPAKTPASGLPINDTRSGSVAIYAVIADGSADTLPFPLSIVAANSRSRAALLPRKALPC